MASVGLAAWGAAAGSGAETSAPAAQARLLQSYGRLPLTFVENRGQTDARVRYTARGRGYSLFLTAEEAVWRLASPVAEENAAGKRSRLLRGAEATRPKSEVLRMRFDGRRAPQVEGLERLPGVHNFYAGADPKQWRTGVPGFARVRYRELWPGIDLVFYSRDGDLEYDFELQPGADPGAIALRFQGASVRLEGDELVLKAGQAELRHGAPVVYQMSREGRRAVTGRYELRGRDRVGFGVGVGVGVGVGAQDDLDGLNDVDSFAFGLQTDVPLGGDWDGDGVGLFRNGTFVLSNDFSGTVAAQFFFQDGLFPVVGDWDGDGITTIGVTRTVFSLALRNQFLLRNTNNAGSADLVFFLGLPGDQPLAGDWNGQP